MERGKERGAGREGGKKEVRVAERGREGGKEREREGRREREGEGRERGEGERGEGEVKGICI